MSSQLVDVPDGGLVQCDDQDKKLMQRIVSNLCTPLSGLIAIYLLVVVIVMPPTGDAILGDDWDFSVSVFDWIREGRLTLSDFPSMTLISHLAWGKIFAISWGSSQWTLRISTMVMAWIGAIALYRISRRLGGTSGLATAFAAAYLFNPMLLFCSYTFLTDVAGCSLMLVFLGSVTPRIALYFSATHASATHGSATQASATQAGEADQSNPGTTPRLRWPLIGAIFVGLLTAFCYLTRQTALIPVIATAILMVPLALRGRLRWLPTVAAVVAFLTPAVVFWWWISSVHGIPLGFEKHMLEFGQLVQPKIVIMKSIRLFLTIGFYLSPFAVGALVCTCWASTRRKQAFVLLGVLVGSLSFFLIPPLRSARLYWGFNFVDFNTGHYPHVEGLRDWLVPTEYSISLMSFNGFDLIAIPLSVASLVCVVVHRKRFEWLIRQSAVNLFHGKTPSIAATAMLAAAGQLLLLLMVWDLFDRYLLPLFTLCIVVVAALLSVDMNGTDDQGKAVNSKPFRLPGLGSLYVVLIGLAIYSIIWTHDTRARFEAAWGAGEQLTESGVPASEIDLGPAFRGTFVYRPELSERLKAGPFRLGDLSVGQRAELIGRLEPRQYWISQRAVPAKLATPLFRVTPKTWAPSESWTVYQKNKASGASP